jgi:hypothetical protein
MEYGYSPCDTRFEEMLMEKIIRAPNFHAKEIKNKKLFSDFIPGFTKNMASKKRPVFFHSFC